METALSEVYKMRQPVEMRKFLTALDQKQSLEELVKWHIPYVRQVKFLREALAKGFIEETGIGLALTVRGKRFVEYGVTERRNKKDWYDPLAPHRTASLDPDEIYIPEEQAR